MQKVLVIISFLISTVFSIKAVGVYAADSLEISYDHVYAVDWTVNIYIVADLFEFPQDCMDDILEVLNAPQKEILADGTDLLWYYLDTSFQEAKSIKDDLENFNLPDGYKWGFGVLEDENHKLSSFIAVCESKSPLNCTIKQAIFEKDNFDNPSIGFSLLQNESEELLLKYKEYMVQPIKHNTLVIEINGRLFAPTQINQLDIPNTRSITISYVPLCVLEELYRPPFNSDPEVTAK